MNPAVRTRLLTGAPLAVLFVFMLLYNALTLNILLYVILFVMLYEFATHSFAGKESAFSYIFLLIGSSVLAILFGVYKFDLSSYLNILLLISAVYILANVIILLTQARSLLYVTPKVLQGFMYITLPFICLFIWKNEFRDAKYFLLASFLMIWASDVAAYFGGKRFGKNKLYEKVSPGKTREGFYSAGLFTVAFSQLLPLFSNHYKPTTMALMAVAIWLFGTAGDLVESTFKRHYKIKDSGTILPGHGGFLDRFDSFIFSIPIILLILMYFN